MANYQAQEFSDLHVKLKNVLHNHILSFTNQQQYEIAESGRATFDEVVAIITRTQAIMMRKDLLHGHSRMAELLDVITDIKKIFDALPSADEMVSYVWGICRLLIQEIDERNDYSKPFSVLVEGYTAISTNAAHVFTETSQLDDTNSRQILLVFIFDQLLDFQGSMLRYMHQKGWKNFSHMILHEIQLKTQQMATELRHRKPAPNDGVDLGNDAQEAQYILRQYVKRRRSESPRSPRSSTSSDLEESRADKLLQAQNTEVPKSLTNQESNQATALNIHDVSISRGSPNSPIIRPSDQNKSSGRTQYKLWTIISIIKEWLTHCGTEHMPCNAFRSSPIRLPTRVIQVGNDAEPESIRLVETNSQPGTYACLSYCWGDTANYTTTPDTLQQHMESIPWASLPKTIQDAITVTRELGISYLWVDALCIVQNSSDWEAEAGKMASVYMNAFVTLGAAATRDCRDGFLDRCWLPDYNWEWVRDTKTVTYNGRSLPRSPHMRAADARASPLFERGWALQELVLSPRTVLFTERGIVWLCKKRGIHKNELGQVEDLSILINLRGDLAGYGASILTSPYTWWSWIADYTSRKLTYESDRLAAIAGVTEYFVSLSGWTPALGLWKENILQDLLWRPLKPSRSLHPKNSAPGIPTWSWLCRQGPIFMPTYFYTARFVTEAQVGDHDVTWDGQPLVGKPLAKLVLCAPLHYASIRRSTRDEAKGAYGLRSAVARRESSRTSWCFSLVTKTPGANDLGPPEFNTGTELGFCTLDRKDDCSRYKLSSDPIIIPCIGIGKHLDEECFREYLLLECVDEEHHKYRRVGVGVLLIEESFEDTEEPRVTINLV